MLDEEFNIELRQASLARQALSASEWDCTTATGGTRQNHDMLQSQLHSAHVQCASHK